MIQSSKGVLKGMGDKHHHPLPPGQSTKVSFLLFPVSLPQTSNTLTCDREKIPHLIPFCKGFTCKKMWKKKKNLFPGKQQRVEYEPGKLLLIHAKLHSQHRTVFLSVIHPFSGCTYFTFTHTENIRTHPPTTLSKNLNPPVSAHSRETPSFWVKIESTSTVFLVTNPGFCRSNSSCICCGNGHCFYCDFCWYTASFLLN